MTSDLDLVEVQPGSNHFITEDFKPFENINREFSLRKGREKHQPPIFVDLSEESEPTMAYKDKLLFPQTRLKETEKTSVESRNSDEFSSRNSLPMKRIRVRTDLFEAKPLPTKESELNSKFCEPLPVVNSKKVNIRKSQNGDISCDISTEKRKRRPEETRKEFMKAVVQIKKCDITLTKNHTASSPPVVTPRASSKLPSSGVKNKRIQESITKYFTKTSSSVKKIAMDSEALSSNLVSSKSNRVNSGIQIQCGVFFYCQKCCKRHPMSEDHPCFSFH